jgi:hypothetical protein
MNKCPSCEYHKGSEKIWRDFAKQQQVEIEALKLCCPKCGGATGKLEVLNVPAKTLTDEEIRHLQAQCHLKNVEYDTFIMRFARAILEKASEK